MRSLTHLSTLALAALSLSTCTAAEPTAPGLEYLYTVNITGGNTTVVGPGPRGVRLIVPILSGSFSGPRLNGTVLPLGGDWPLIDANNLSQNSTVTLDVRQTFLTSDGAVIQVFETGASQPDGTGHVRLAFETGSAEYYWLNAVVAVGILRIGEGGGISIDAWQMTSPKV